MKKLAAVCVVLVAALSAAAQDLQVTGDGVKTVVVIAKLPFTITAPANGADYLWKVPQGVTYAERDNAIDVTQAPNGELAVSVRVLTVDFDAKKVTRKVYVTTVVVGGAKPPDPPAPTGKVAWVIVVEESAERTVQTARILGDLGFWRSVIAKGVGWHVYDKDDPVAVSNGYLPDAQKAGFPAMLLMNDKGKILKAMKLPASTADVLKEIGP